MKKIILPLIVLAIASVQPLVSQTTSPPATSSTAQTKDDKNAQTKQDKKAAKAKSKTHNKAASEGATTPKQDAAYALDEQKRTTPQNPHPQ